MVFRDEKIRGGLVVNIQLLMLYPISIRVRLRVRNSTFDGRMYELTWAAQAQNETFMTTSYEYGRFSQVEVTRTRLDFTQKFQLRCLATHAHTVETG